MLDWLVEIIIEKKKMSLPPEAYTDVVELCGLLQCLGFRVRSLNATECNASLEAGARTVVISCPASGVQVVLESGSALCSCPPEANAQNSGIRQVSAASGVTGGKQLDKEFGCSILGSLAKQHRDLLSRDLRAIVQCISKHSVFESELEMLRERANKSASMVEITITPEPLPLRQAETVVLENLVVAKTTEELWQKLASIIKQYGEEGKDDSPMSSLALDVSKISILKGSEPTKTQFASSPNLSTGLGKVYDAQKNKLKRVDMPSTSNLMPKKTSNQDGGVASKLRPISPNYLSVKSGKLKPQDSKNSISNPKFKSESTSNLNASKKRFSHIKSAIPRPTLKKD